MEIAALLLVVSAFFGAIAWVTHRDGIDPENRL